jgi:hypothetical protein
MKLVNLQEKINGLTFLEDFCTSCMSKFLLNKLLNGEIYVPKQAVKDFFRYVNRAEACEETAEVN